MRSSTAPELIDPDLIDPDLIDPDLIDPAFLDPDLSEVFLRFVILSATNRLPEPVCEVEGSLPGPHTLRIAF
jgi:hypothetical protein